MKYKVSGKAITYFVLRFIVVGFMILEFVERDYYNAFLCVLTLLLFMIPTFLKKRLNIVLPTPLEYTILFFIFAAEILGEIQKFYLLYPHWDTILHTLNGFIMAGIGLSMIDILNRSESLHFNMSPVFVCLVAFCFSMTIGVLWEFFEYGMDRFTDSDMQKDTVRTEIASVNLNPDGENDSVVIDGIGTVTVSGYIDGEKTDVELDGYLDIGLEDTMGDLFVNFIGALIFTFAGFFYLNGLGRLAKGFIPKLRRKKEKTNED